MSKKPCTAIVGRGYVLVQRSSIVDLLEYAREASSLLGGRRICILESMDVDDDAWNAVLEGVHHSIDHNRIVCGSKVAIEAK